MTHQEYTPTARFGRVWSQLVMKWGEVSFVRAWESYRAQALTANHLAAELEEDLRRFAELFETLQDEVLAIEDEAEAAAESDFADPLLFATLRYLDHRAGEMRAELEASLEAEVTVALLGSGISLGVCSIRRDGVDVAAWRIQPEPGASC